MAFSGGAMGAPMAAGPASSSTVRQFKLDKECELRIEVSDASPLRLRLLNGTAEIFGSELPPEIWLTFPPRLKFGVSFLRSNSTLHSLAQKPLLLIANWSLLGFSCKFFVKVSISYQLCSKLVEITQIRFLIVNLRI